MGEEAVARQFAADAVLLKLLGLHPGRGRDGRRGPQISAMLDRAGVKSTFVDGLRVTDEPTMEVAEMVLSGAINKEIADLDLRSPATPRPTCAASGLSGKDARLITVEKLTRTKKDPDSMIEQSVDLGFVGQPSRVDPKLLEALIYADEDYIPVVAPIGTAVDGQTFNINADTVAGALASALKAKRMLLLTDVVRACSTPTGN